MTKKFRIVVKFVACIENYYEEVRKYDFDTYQEAELFLTEYLDCSDKGWIKKVYMKESVEE